MNLYSTKYTQSKVVSLAFSDQKEEIYYISTPGMVQFKSG